MTSREVKFNEWKWEEEVEVFTLEHIGLGKTSLHRLVIILTLFSALIINAVGLIISIIVFIIELIIYKISLRRAAHVTQDRLEVDYQGGEEPSLTVVKTVMDMEQEEKTKSK